MPTRKRPSEPAPKRPVPRIAAKKPSAKKPSPGKRLGKKPVAKTPVAKTPVAKTPVTAPPVLAPAAKSVEKPIDKPIDKPAAVATTPETKPVEKPIEKAAPLAPSTSSPVVAASVAAPATEMKADPAVEAAPVASFLPARLVELFRLSAIEQRAIYHLLSSDRPLSVATLADRLELEVAATIVLLSPEGTLRGRALIETEARAGLGFPAPSDPLTAGRGLHLWCVEGDKLPIDEALLFAAHAPGVTYFSAPAPGTTWAQDLIGEKRPAGVAEAVRDHLGAGQAVALWLNGVGPGELTPLVWALRARLVRPVVLIESAALVGWPVPELCAALRRLRRDADLRGAAVVVSDVKLLGGAYRALCQPRPVGQTAPVIFCSSDDKPPIGKLPAGAAFETPLVPTMTSLVRTAPPLTAAANSTADEASVDPALLASREEARRRGAYDAARAMGRPIPAELNEPAKVVAPLPPAPKQQPAPAAAAPPVPAYRAPAPTFTPPAPAEAAEPSPSGRPVNPRLAAALAKAGLPPPGSTSYQSEQFAQRPADTASAAVEAPPVVLPASAPAIAATPTDASAEAAAAPPAAPPVVLEDDQPALPLEENAPLDEVIRVARTTPNNAQRIKILQDLMSKRAPSVIQLFRAFVTHAHPGVRAAAEAGMAALFGSNWNRARTIAPPVQPPRSDDNGRGPGGAF